MQNLKISVFLIGLFFLWGCVFSRAELASQAKTSMVGMTKEEVLICMGGASQKQKEGNTEVWTYNSGGDSRGTVYGQSFGQSSAIGTLSLRKRYCVVNIVFREGKVNSVNYGGRTGGLLTKGEQCAFAVENCVQPPSSIEQGY